MSRPLFDRRGAEPCETRGGIVTRAAASGAIRASIGLTGVGVVALALGLLVYLTDRDASRSLLIPAVGALAGSSVFGSIGYWMPSFVHPFAFSLLTAAAQRPSGRPPYWACLLWWAINVAFEFAQHPVVSPLLAAAVETAAGRMSALAALSAYCTRGTFDAGDLVAASAGALAAAGVLLLVRKREV